MSSENLNQLIDALKDYQKTSNLETLRNLTPEQRETIRSYKIEFHSVGNIPIAHKEQLDKFENAEATLIEAINNYIDDRIKQFTKSID